MVHLRPRSRRATRTSATSNACASGRTPHSRRSAWHSRSAGVRSGRSIRTWPPRSAPWACCAPRSATGLARSRCSASRSRLAARCRRARSASGCSARCGSSRAGRPPPSRHSGRPSRSRSRRGCSPLATRAARSSPGSRPIPTSRWPSRRRGSPRRRSKCSSAERAGRCRSTRRPVRAVRADNLCSNGCSTCCRRTRRWCPGCTTGWHPHAGRWCGRASCDRQGHRAGSDSSRRCPGFPVAALGVPACGTSCAPPRDGPCGSMPAMRISGWRAP